MTDKLEAGIRYQFSEPFRTRAEELMNGIGLPDRSRHKEPTPPTAGQLAYLKRLGYSGDVPPTVWETSKLIDSLLHK